MNIDINLVNSLKVGEFIQVSETEVLSCVEGTGCKECYFTDYDWLDCPLCGNENKMYQIKLKQ